MHLRPVRIVIKTQNPKNLCYKIMEDYKIMGMLLYKKVPYSIAERNYKIKVLYDNNTINIVAFENHYPANGFRHQIKISKNLEMKEILQQKVIDEVIEICKRDISEKRWERLNQ